MKVETVSFVVASDQNIIYMLLIEFDAEDIVQYENLLGSCLHLLDWIYGDAAFPSARFGDGLQQKGYHVDSHSIRLHLQLWKSAHSLIQQYQKPLLVCRYIVPSEIAYCNKSKGFVSVMSRYLGNIKIPFKCAGLVLQFVVVRFINILFVNGYLAMILTSLNEEDFF